MNITLVEPFFGGSHRQWAEGYRRQTAHQVQLLTLPGRHWKWRMHGAAVTLARQFLESAAAPDLLLAGDMLDLSTFLALLRPHARLPSAIYFHENQLTYPWSPEDPDIPLQRNNQYAFINYTSCLVADRLFFNSHYHRRSFLEALEPFLRQFPDFRELETVAAIEAKSEVLPLGLDLQSLNTGEPVSKPGKAVLLWNHRWEYDKDPDAFFRVLRRLQKDDVPFLLVVLGESFRKAPAVFDRARSLFSDQLLYIGYAADRKTYARWLWTADILPVTSRQDFFGGSTVEAIYCNCHPILPNRLAFPEHLPESVRAEHLFNDEEELYRKLKEAVLRINEVRQRNDYRDFVARYDWSKLAPVYDRRLQQVVGSI